MKALKKNRVIMTTFYFGIFRDRLCYEVFLGSKMFIH